LASGGAGGEYYHWRPVSFNHSADANHSWSSRIDPVYQKKCNYCQLRAIHPAAAGVLVGGGSRAAHQLQYGATLLGGLYPFP